MTVRGVETGTTAKGQPTAGFLFSRKITQKGFEGNNENQTVFQKGRSYGNGCGHSFVPVADDCVRSDRRCGYDFLYPHLRFGRKCDVLQFQCRDQRLHCRWYRQEQVPDTLLNIDHPEDYRGRSLSVSDVVEVYESDAIPQGFYFCDSFGFKQVTFHPEKCGISERMNEQSTEIISVLLVEPGKYPRMIEIEDSLEAMQRVVGGDIEEFMPYEDDIAIICNEEGKMNGMSPNRAIYSEPEEVEMTYGELTGRFRQAEREGRHISGYIVFTQDSFTEAYSEEQRTYAVSSNNKAFIEGMGGYSIYASSLDGSDPCVRLEAYMADEHGGKDGWKIERCYMKDPESREMVDIIFGQFFVCYAPAESEKFLSLPKELAQKYEARFKFPERFFKQGNEIKAVPYKPKTRGQER